MSGTERALEFLVVDDHPLVRVAFRVVLHRHFPGARLVEAGCAADALAACAGQRFHLALVDVNLPGVSGVDLLQQLRRAAPGMPVLMVAAAADPWTIQASLANEAAGFVAKSCPPSLLCEAVEGVLGGAEFLCPDSAAALRRLSDPARSLLTLPGPAVFSPRERDVLARVAAGEDTKQIASLLQLSPKTVESHRQSIARKLGTSNVALQTRYALRHGLVVADGEGTPGRSGAAG